MFLVLALVYFLPTIIAICRKCNIGLTLLVNLFLGWTCIGWIVALVLALKGAEPVSLYRQPTIVINNTNTNAAENANVHQQVNNSQTDSETTDKKTKKTSQNEYSLMNDIANFCKQHQKTIGKTLLVIAAIFGTLFIFALIAVLIEDSEFNKKISFYKTQSTAFVELYDCENVDIDIREPLCKCLYEYSLKIKDEYFDKKYELSNARYDYSYQKDKALENLLNKYQQQGINICSKAI